MHKQPVRDWLDDRTGYRTALQARLDRPVPGRAGLRHTLPRCLAFLFLVDALTGVLMMTVYSPSPTTAWGSVFYLEHTVTLGWWVRGIHHYASWLLIGLLPFYLLHLVLSRLYVPPRELAYWCGLLFIPLLVGLGLTGNVLPWDEGGYWAIRTETNIVATLPIVGDTLQRIIVGGSELGQATITRLYTLHVLVLPAAVVGLWFLYRWLRKPASFDGPSYWPHQAWRNLAAYTVLMILAMGMTLLWRTPLDSPADPLGKFPPRPEWYVAFLYSLRLYFENSNELYATAVIPGGVALLLMMFPLIGRIRFRRLAHGFVVLLTLALVGSMVTLTGLAVAKDHRDESYQQKLAVFQTYADRAVELASMGIPPEGASELLLRDSKTRGPILFRDHCVRCHKHTEIAGPGGKAANLTGFGSVDWIERFIADPGHDDFLGQVEKLNRMADWADENVEDIGPKGVRAVAEFLAAGAPPEPTADDNPTTTQATNNEFHEGREVFREYCIECHSLATEEPKLEKKRKGKALDLTSYAQHAWLWRMMNEPDHRDLYGRKNMMPSFGDQLSSTEMEVIIQWLTGEP